MPSMLGHGWARIARVMAVPALSLAFLVAAPGITATVGAGAGNSPQNVQAAHSMYLPLILSGSAPPAPPFRPTPTSTAAAGKTSTPIPPTATVIRPTATPIPPTATPVPPTATPSPSSVSCETRGSWINDYAVPLGDGLLDTLQHANINTVFVLIPPVGGNNGWSDPALFATFTSHAQARGFSVHGWFANAFRTSSVNYSDPAEQQAQAAWAVSLLDAYPYLDGVHFDYIRSMSYGSISTSLMNGVAATVAKARAAVVAKYPGKVLTSSSFPAAPRSRDSSDQTPSWFLNYVSANPGGMYGTSSVPQFMKYQQDPPSWIRNGNEDAVAPMEYTQNDSAWDGDAAAWKSFLTSQQANGTKIYMGLPWYKVDPTTGDGGFDAAGNVRKINYGRSIGIKGFVFFEFGGRSVDDTPLVNALTVPSAINNNQPPFASAAPSCLPH